jgi:hypothetical protein
VFVLERFERLVYARDHDRATDELAALLRFLDLGGGALERLAHEDPGAPRTAASLDEPVLARLAGAITALAADPGFRVSDRTYRRLLAYHAWLACLFHAGPFGNTDHLLRAMGADGAGSGLRIAAADLAKFCLFYTAESAVTLDVEALWAHDRRLAAGLLLMLCAPVVLASPAAHAKREALLGWLAARLPELGDTDGLPMDALHHVFMNCSYADGKAKHAIKRPINALIRGLLAAHGLGDRHAPRVAVEPARKATLLVVVERFTAGSSIYRTHSRGIEALRTRFHVVGIGPASAVDAAGRTAFDEFRALEPAQGVLAMVAAVRQLAVGLDARALYLPSVGMEALTTFLANLRIAPLQIMGLGHPATSHSPCIDYVVVEEDFVGDEACFSERLLKLPRDGMPYRLPPPAAERPPPRARVPEAGVRIAVAATPMKLNPTFLATCASIVARARVPVRLRFFVASARGLIHQQVAKEIRRVCGDAAEVHPHLAYGDYLEGLAACDLFLSPFPFGNTNGIVDAVAAGLVGVCRTGPEVHEHIDGALFRRLGWPRWLVAASREEYESAALRLVDDAAERGQLAATRSGEHALRVFLDGRPAALAEALDTLLRPPGDG